MFYILVEVSCKMQLWSGKSWLSKLDLDYTWFRVPTWWYPNMFIPSFDHFTPLKPMVLMSLGDQLFLDTETSYHDSLIFHFSKDESSIIQLFFHKVKNKCVKRLCPTRIVRSSHVSLSLPLLVPGTNPGVSAHGFVACGGAETRFFVASSLHIEHVLASLMWENTINKPAMWE